MEVFCSVPRTTLNTKTLSLVFWTKGQFDQFYSLRVYYCIPGTKLQEFPLYPGLHAVYIFSHFISSNWIFDILRWVTYGFSSLSHATSFKTPIEIGCEALFISPPPTAKFEPPQIPSFWQACDAQDLGQSIGLHTLSHLPMHNPARDIAVIHLTSCFGSWDYVARNGAPEHRREFQDKTRQDGEFNTSPSSLREAGNKKSQKSTYICLIDALFIHMIRLKTCRSKPWWMWEITAF